MFGTGWFAADAANVKPGMTVVVVGDGAVGLLAVLSAKQMGAKRIIAMSRHEARQKLAREFGATDIVTERGEDGVARIKELTDGTGADAVLECVGTQESMLQAIHSARPGGSVGYVGVPYEAKLDFISPGGGGGLFFSHVRLHGGPAPVRRFLPELIDLVWNRKINPGKVFDLTLPLEEVAEGYRAMDERRAIKALLRPSAASPDPIDGLRKSSIPSYEARMKRKLSPAFILTATMAGVIAPGCAVARGADDRAPARGTPSEKTSTVKIGIKLDEKTLTATLHDNATSKDFVSLLPLRLTLKDYAATEKISDLPKRLSTEGAPAGSDPDVGDIAYYAPWGNLAIFYKDAAYADGLIKLAKIATMRVG